jgi:xylulokinase
MSRRHYLGLDVGTQGTKGVVLDFERGEVVASASSAYGLIEGLPDGAAEQHPATWEAAIRAVVAQLFAQPGVNAAELAGVGVSGQQHGCVVLDAGGDVIRPAKLWCDTSTADEARELSLTLGRNVPTGFTASKLLWLKRREPEHFARVRRVLLPHEWVNWRLTQRATAEPGDASGTGFFDVRARRYDLAALAAIDPRLAECLPQLIESREPAGELTREGARFLGLDEAAAGALVSAGGGDNMLSAVGSGAVEPGVVTLSLGTSATVFAYSAAPCVDPEGAIAPFCDSTGAWLPLLCVMNATAVLSELAEAFERDIASLTAAAETAPPGCNGLLFVPYLVGERVPDLPRSCGVLHGLRPGSLRGGVLFRAALEGVALNLAWGLERMRALGLPQQSVRAVGGGARNALWLSILASAFEIPVQPLAHSESAALGAALQARWTRANALEAADVSLARLVRPFVHFDGPPFEPRAELVRLYREQLARLRELVGTLFPA